MKNYIFLGLALLVANLSLAQNGRSRAEVFIEIEERGNFTVYLDNEFIGSSNGKFRFYDVYASTATLAIVQGNKKIFSSKLTTRPEERLILNYGIRQGLRTIKTLKIYRNGQYALNDFDGYGGAYNTGIVPPKQGIDDRQDTFDNLSAMVKREPFDDEKVKLIQIYAQDKRLTTAQTATLMQTMMRDENKLQTAKAVFSSILDPQNFYLLKDSFTFNAAKEEFLKYLSNASSSQLRLLNQTDYERLKAEVRREAFDDNKTKLILAAFQNAGPTTEQVGSLLKLYSFEEKALNCAKMVMPNVVDKQKYYSLKDIFTFKSNQDAFLDFLDRQ